MSETLPRIVRLVAEELTPISDHVYERLDKHGLFADELFFGVANAVVVEDYPRLERSLGPWCCSTMVGPVHVLWGMPKGQEAPAVITTAYRSDPLRWSADIMIRSKP